MKKYNLWMLAAILTICGTMTTLTSCSEYDNPVVTPTDQNPLEELLTGDWYSTYSATGTTKAWLRDSKTTETTIDYMQVMDHYYFGSQEPVPHGTLIRYYYASGDKEPSAFNIIFLDYTSTKDKSAAGVSGDIRLTFKANTWPWRENAPTRATLYYNNGSITASGQDNQEISLTAADEQMTDYLKRLWGQGGYGDPGMADYNINLDWLVPGRITKDNWHKKTTIYCYTTDETRVNHKILDSRGGSNYYEVPLPWANGGTYASLPVNFCKGMTPENGWNLVMVYCGRRHPSDANYIALYNKYSGKLRMFYYIPEHIKTNNASGYHFQVLMPSALAEHSPFMYPVPYERSISNPKSIGVDVTNGDYWSQYITPYCAAPDALGQVQPKPGWQAIDIDLSLYRQKTFTADGSPLQLITRATTKSVIDLIGSQTGSITGSIDMKQCSVNSESGVFGPIESLLSKAGDLKELVSNITDTYTKFTKGDIFDGVKGVVDAAKAGCDFVGIDYGQKESGFNGYQGEANLKLETRIDMKGTSTEQAVITGLADPQIPMKYFDFDGTGFGEGVWNLQKAPVVCYTNTYVDWRRLDIGSEEKFHYILYPEKMPSPFGGQPYLWANQNYDTKEEKPYRGRICFFEPSNIQVNINHNVFPENDIDYVKTFAVCGVRKGVKFGSTEKYRTAQGLASSKYKVSNAWNYHNRPLTEVPFDALESHHGGQYDYSNTDKWKTGATFDAENYDGRKWGLVGRGDSEYLIEPMALCGDNETYKSSDTKRYYDAEMWMPPYEVTVTMILKLKSKPTPFVFTRSYLPDYKYVDPSDLYKEYEYVQNHRGIYYDEELYKYQQEHIFNLYNWCARTFVADGGTPTSYGLKSFGNAIIYDDEPESFYRAIDGDVNTEWKAYQTDFLIPNVDNWALSSNYTVPTWFIEFHTHMSAKPKQLVLWTGLDAPWGRPSSICVYAKRGTPTDHSKTYKCDDWVGIYSNDNLDLPTTPTTKYVIDIPTMFRDWYNCYRIEIRKLWKGDDIHLGEIQLVYEGDK